jgi:hypothetical protein
MFEVKMGKAEEESAAASLFAVKKHIDTSKKGEPAVMGIITAGQYAYKRDDGIVVIPIGCLKD